jgi:CheY-like chemotaxis protein
MNRGIAIVEDDEDNRLLLRTLLDDEFDVREYATGPEALAGLTETEHPDHDRAEVELVLLDISLPGMDGVRVLQAMRDDPRLASLPVIALTGHAMTGDRERLLEAGFDEYVPKPILDERLLLATIERLIYARTH